MAEEASSPVTMMATATKSSAPYRLLMNTLLCTTTRSPRRPINSCSFLSAIVFTVVQFAMVLYKIIVNLVIHHEFFVNYAPFIASVLANARLPSPVIGDVLVSLCVVDLPRAAVLRWRLVTLRMLRSGLDAPFAKHVSVASWPFEELESR